MDILIRAMQIMDPDINMKKENNSRFIVYFSGAVI